MKVMIPRIILRTEDRHRSVVTSTGTVPPVDEHRRKWVMAEVTPADV